MIGLQLKISTLSVSFRMVAKWADIPDTPDMPSWQKFPCNERVIGPDPDEHVLCNADVAGYHPVHLTFE